MVAKSKKPRLQTSAPTKSELLFKVGKDVPKWYSIENSSSSKSFDEKYDKQKCEQIYRSECELYQKFYQQDQSSDYQWLQTSLSTTSKVKQIPKIKNFSNKYFFLGSSCCFSYINSSFTCSFR
jgi:hypothetical protein